MCPVFAFFPKLFKFFFSYRTFPKKAILGHTGHTFFHSLFYTRYYTFLYYLLKIIKTNKNNKN